MYIQSKQQEITLKNEIDFTGKNYSALLGQKHFEAFCSYWGIQSCKIKKKCKRAY